MKVVPTTTKY